MRGKCRGVGCGGRGVARTDTDRDGDELQFSDIITDFAPRDVLCTWYTIVAATMFCLCGPPAMLSTAMARRQDRVESSLGQNFVSMSADCVCVGGDRSGRGGHQLIPGLHYGPMAGRS